MIMRESASGKSSFRPEIEGLRGVAVLLVVLFHAHIQWLSGGYVGVDIFFVISGYLITNLLVRELESTGRIRFLEFYARRARRLLPAAVTVILASLIVTSVLYAPIEQHWFAKTGLTAALYSSNLLFAHHATDYLAPVASENPLLHTWSLGVEEQFYLFWPLFLMLATYRGLKESTRRRLCMLFGAMAVVSFAACFWLTRIVQPWAFFLMPTRGWEFCVGGLVALYRDRLRLSSGLLALIGASAICISGIAFTTKTHFPGTAALLPVMGAAILLAMRMDPSKDLCARALASPPLKYLGRVSYSWYLWHWPVLVFGAVLFPASRTAAAACVLLSLGLAIVTYLTIEAPVRVNRHLMMRPRLSINFAVLLTVLCAGLCDVYLYGTVRFGNSPEQRRIANASNDLPKVYRDGCHLSVLAIESPKCAFGDTGSKTTVVLFGDSHAAQWFPALEQIAIDKHWRLLSFTKSSCPVPLIDVYEATLNRSYTECSQWRTDTIQRIIALRPLLVVLSSFSEAYIENGVTSAAWVDGFRRTAAMFANAGIRNIVISDPAPPDFDPLICLARSAWNHGISTCRYQPDSHATQTLVREEDDALDRLANVYVLDLSSEICSDLSCDPVRHGSIVYRDRSHITSKFSASLSPVLEFQIEKILHAAT